MPEKSRLQVRTNADPEVYEDVGSGSAGVPIPVSVESSELPTGAATSSNQTDGSQKTQIVDSLPTAGNNPSTVLAYTGSNLTTITETINGVQYRTTLGYDGSNNLTSISSIVEI